ncbi:hypothetical protein [Yeosuana sp.]|uniref:hypothetical protein n=1 Tax=Yeosuana sp. TaxID=2529388 RepID=UPI004054E1A6
MIVKNTYGISVAFSTAKYGITPKSEFAGSAIDRKKTVVNKIIKAKKKESEDKERKVRSLSRRSKQKIRKKITCFSRTQKRLSFVTLTFLNSVSDEIAVNILRKFIDNVKKRSEDFQYIWVVERQTKNDEFKGNPQISILFTSIFFSSNNSVILLSNNSIVFLMVFILFVFIFLVI